MRVQYDVLVLGGGLVVEEDLRLRGLENLYVCDASVIRTIPRANTHLTTLAIAEKLGSEL